MVRVHTENDPPSSWSRINRIQQKDAEKFPFMFKGDRSQCCSVRHRM